MTNSDHLRPENKWNNWNLNGKCFSPNLGEICFGMGTNREKGNQHEVQQQHIRIEKDGIETEREEKVIADKDECSFSSVGMLFCRF